MNRAELPATKGFTIVHHRLRSMNLASCFTGATVIEIGAYLLLYTYGKATLAGLTFWKTLKNLIQTPSTIWWLFSRHVFKIRLNYREKKLKNRNCEFYLRPNPNGKKIQNLTDYGSNYNNTKSNITRKVFNNIMHMLWRGTLLKKAY